MRVFVVGGGGREHALVWALSRSSAVGEIVCAPGNPGIAAIADCRPVRADDVGGLVELAHRSRPDLVVVGPEAPLASGLADALGSGHKVFGPTSRGARLESSKSYAKSLMNRNGIPTASSATFDDADEAASYALKQEGPLVVKADGLAAGKGVTVCATPVQAAEAVRAAMVGLKFGRAGSRVLIEEHLSGPELSLLAFCDGTTVLPMQPAQDFKRALDGDRGPNTGGMGSYSPVPACTSDVFEEAVYRVLEPIAAALADEGEHYIGVIYAGLMLTGDGLKVIEFNCRFGDPETQALLPRLESDLAEVMLATVEGGLSGAILEWKPEACVTVVAASEGYPDRADLVTGLPISGLPEREEEDAFVFHSGTALKDGRVVTAGGRVISVSALGSDISQAREKAFEHMERISFDGMHYRSDIALAAADLERKNPIR